MIINKFNIRVEPGLRLGNDLEKNWVIDIRMNKSEWEYSFYPAGSGIDMNEYYKLLSTMYLTVPEALRKLIGLDYMEEPPSLYYEGHKSPIHV